MEDNPSYLTNEAIIVLGYSNGLKHAMVRLDGNIVGLVLLASILDSGWEHREGNSPQDLLLSLKGWIFGKRLLNQEIQSLNGAKNWLIQNLRETRLNEGLRCQHMFRHH